MFSYEDRLRAVQLYIKLGKRIGLTIRQLGNLSPTLDCFDGMVVSWSIGTRPNAGLVNTMLDAAIDKVAASGERLLALRCRRSGGHREGQQWVLPVRVAGKQSSEPRDRPAATRGQLYLVELPLGPALVAEPNVGLKADTVSTPAGVDRLLTLQNSHPDPPCPEQQSAANSAWSAVPTASV